MLERLFDDPELLGLRATQPGHPAIAAYEAARLLTQPVSYEDEAAKLAALWLVTLDVATWAAPTHDGRDLRAIASDEAIRQLRTRISQPDQYLETMAELFTTGWLRSKGVPAVLVEEEGMPDVVVEGQTPPARVEIKRIRHTSSVNRVRRVIGKANKQFKKADAAHSGVLFIFIERDGTRLALDHGPPSDVRTHIAAAQHEMTSGHWRSVGAVVLSWDDVMVAPAPGGSGSTYFLTRRSVEISNTHAHSDDHPARNLDLGTTFVTRINYPAPLPNRQLDAVNLDGFVASQQFRQLSEFPAGIRPGHVAEVLADPHGRDVFDLDGTVVTLWAREVRAGPPGHVLLVETIERVGHPLEVTAAYRLFDSGHDLAELARRPSSAFGALLDRFGLEIRVGQKTGKFIERSVVLSGIDGSLQFVQGLGDRPDQLHVSCLVQVDEAGRSAKVSWAYAIDRSAYLSTMP